MPRRLFQLLDQQYQLVLTTFPCFVVNIEDHLTISSGKQNAKFDTVLNYFLEECGARLHWGKAGWPTHNACFDGAVDYPDTWCDFGCATYQLDPEGKFSGESDVWRWNMTTTSGSPASFSSCCTANGFNKEACTCQPAPIC